MLTTPDEKHDKTFHKNETTRPAMMVALEKTNNTHLTHEKQPNMEALELDSKRMESQFDHVQHFLK